MVSNDSPTWKVSEGNMNTETVRIILTKNLSKRKPCAKKGIKKSVARQEIL
jgi:hypothetical protein